MGAKRRGAALLSAFAALIRLVAPNGLARADAFGRRRSACSVELVGVLTINTAPPDRD